MERKPTGKNLYRPPLPSHRTEQKVDLSYISKGELNAAHLRFLSVRCLRLRDVKLVWLRLHPLLSGRKHDGHLDPQDALFDENRAPAGVDARPIATLDHVALAEFHRLCTLLADFAFHDDFDAEGAGLHGEPEDVVARLAHRDLPEELVAERLGLRGGTQAPAQDFVGVDLETALGEVEPSLDERRQLAEALVLWPHDVLRLRGADEDVRALWRDAVLDAAVAELGELSLEKLVQLGGEHSIGDKLLLFVQLAHCRENMIEWKRGGKYK